MGGAGRAEASDFQVLIAQILPDRNREQTQQNRLADTSFRQVRDDIKIKAMVDGSSVELPEFPDVRGLPLNQAKSKLLEKGSMLDNITTANVAAQNSQLWGKVQEVTAPRTAGVVSPHAKIQIFIYPNSS